MTQKWGGVPSGARRAVRDFGVRPYTDSENKKRDTRTNKAFAWCLIPDPIHIRAPDGRVPRVEASRHLPSGDHA